MSKAESCFFMNGSGQVRYYSLARYALLHALRLAGVGHGSRVLLPAYLCRDLLAPLHLLGAKACWYDVAPDLSPAAPEQSWPQADVVLAVNYFGFAQNLVPFLQYVQRTGATLIEDNAHGYLSRDEQGQWLGCRTQLGLFSLRKTLRIPDGAALWIDPVLAARELPEQEAFDGAGVQPAQLKKARMRSIPLIGDTIFSLSTKFARQLRRWRTGSAIPPVDPESEQILPAGPNPWHGLLPALARQNAQEEIERRRTAYQQCDAYAKQVGANAVFAELPLLCAPYGYAFRADTQTLAAMQRYADRKRFDLVSWPDLPTDIVERAPSHYRNLYLMNFLW